MSKPTIHHIQIESAEKKYDSVQLDLDFADGLIEVSIGDVIARRASCVISVAEWEAAIDAYRKFKATP